MRCPILALVVLLTGHGHLSAQAILAPRISAPRVVPFGGPGFGSPILPAGYPAPIAPVLGYGGMAYPFPGAMGLTAPIYPGFGADTPVRMRPTVYPAIPLPPIEVIEAKLAGADASKASFTLDLPSSNARVWLDGVRMSQTGTERRFITPPLEDPDASYVFQVRVEWDSRRGPQSRVRHITVSPGSDRTIQIR